MRWAEIHEVRAVALPERMNAGSVPGVRACVYLVDGKRVGLPCVDGVEVSAVHTEVAFIRSVWSELRGPGWRRDPDVAARIDRADARREWLWRACFGVGAARCRHGRDHCRRRVLRGALRLTATPGSGTYREDYEKRVWAGSRSSSML